MKYSIFINITVGLGLLLVIHPQYAFSQSNTSEQTPYREIPMHTVEAPEYVPGEVIVKLKEPLRQQGQDSNVKGATTDSELSRMYKVELDEAAPIEEVVDYLNNSGEVEYAEPNYIYTLDRIPNDPAFYPDFSIGHIGQWGLHNTGLLGSNGIITPSDIDIDAAEAWDRTTGSDTIIVAVVDTGVDYNHPDLAGNIWVNTQETAGNGIDDDGNGFIDDVFGCNFQEIADSVNGIICPDPMDTDGHGTHVAGIIGARGNNSRGITGTAWNVRIMSLKMFNDDNVGTAISAANATLYAVENGADIINNSWGQEWYSQILYDTLEYARQQDVLVIASAGNEGVNTDLSQNQHIPSSYDLDNIISVGATDYFDNRASFSNYGQATVDVLAPGEFIISTYPMQYEYNYVLMSGTSQAAPFVSGAAALIKSAHPSWTYGQIKNAILSTVDVVPGADRTVSGGRLNANAALAYQTAQPTPSPTPIPTTTPTPQAACDVFRGDANCDGTTNAIDFVLWYNTWTSGQYNPQADFDGNGQVGASDFVVWFNNY